MSPSLFPFLFFFFLLLSPGHRAPHLEYILLTSPNNRAFTQLLADRQFAQLGLMLIGVLAQVEASLAPFVRPAEPLEGDNLDEKAGPDPAQAAVARMAAGRAGGGPVASQVGGRSSLDAAYEDDLGVAISRDELGDDDEGEDEDVASRRARRPSPPAGQPPPKEKRREKGESKGKKRPRADDTGSSTIGKPEKPARPESSRDEKKAKKKKKKGGDEFDDLFSSLM